MKKNKSISRAGASRNGSTARATASTSKPGRKAVHAHDWRYTGFIVFSTERRHNGKYHWVCSGCDCEMYSAGLMAVGERLVERG